MFRRRSLPRPTAGGFPWSGSRTKRPSSPSENWWRTHSPRITVAKLERLIAGHQILARALLTGGGLTQLLKHLGGMLRTEIALTQFTALLYNSTDEPPSARTWASYPIPTGRRDACTLWVGLPFEDSGIIGYAQNLITWS